MATVLFVCLHNAGRSQISAALLEREADGRHVALSAGTTPGEHVHPEVVQVMGFYHHLYIYMWRCQFCVTSPQAMSVSRQCWASVGARKNVISCSSVSHGP